MNEPTRRRLPDDRQSIVHRFEIAGHEGYLILGIFPDGTPGELFISMAKEGSTIGGLADSFAKVVSIALQYGVPLEVLVRKFAHQRFEPSGYTTNADVKFASSIVDYVFRWLDAYYKKKREQPVTAIPAKTDAPSCAKCGQLMTQTETGYTCWQCGFKPTAGS